MDSWGQLVTELEKLTEGFVFRGHGDANWPLMHSLERHTPAGWTCSEAESLLEEEFSRRAHNYLEPHQMPATHGEWLALMQHFGAPTRLVDVTRSPFIAAYFAVEEIPGNASVAAVWAINLRWCREACGKLVMNSPAALVIPEGMTPSGNAEWTFSRLPKPDTIGWHNGLPRMVVPYCPTKLSERLSVQQGEFLVPSEVDVPFMDNWSEMRKALPKGGVIRFTLPKSERSRALRQLRLMNVSRTSLFPGLDGFAQSFRQLLVEETAQSRNLRHLVKDPQAHKSRSK